jgi:heat shock protein 4
MYLGEQRSFTATQLYAMYLGKLRDIAHAESKAPVNNVVIAVPGWYTDVQRRAVLDAAEIAGLNALKLINEGTATAFGYGITKTDLPAPEDKARTVAFVDIGHSHYTVTIAAFNRAGVSIKAAAYDRHFGGRDIDYALVQHFATVFQSKYKIDVMSNKKAIFRLQVAVERLKKILSANLQAPLSVESIMDDIDASAVMTRDEFEGLIQDVLSRTEAPLQAALAQSGLTKDDIDFVELVGG